MNHYAKSDCDYSGPLEYGDFNDKEFPLLRLHARCPKCKGFDIIMEADEHVEMDMRYPPFCRGPEKPHKPAQMVVVLMPPSGPKGVAAYSVHCNVCKWGSGGGLLTKDYQRLLELSKTLRQQRHASLGVKIAD
jgi:hypothetical protein